jgi:tetratricopeptide (TPR) repeat protein
LDPDRKNRVEEHAFLCARCGVRLASLQAAHDFVRTGNGLAGPVAAKEDGTKRGKTPGVVVWIVAALASAAATAILLLGTLDRDEMQASAKRLSALDPPEIPASTSLPSDSPHLETFRRAVAAYERGSYSEAAREWERLYEAEASVRDLGLYLGVSQLIEGRAEEAAATLARSLPEGEAATPYHFYRAQALLVAGHVEEAREELRVVLSAGESIYREDAARQLTSLLGPPEDF